MIDGLLIMGFGGPTPGCCGRRPSCPHTPGCEAACFVAGVLGDNPARAPRIAEVAGHYHRNGGFSPYNAMTAAQAHALAAELARRGHHLHVACGYRNWTPWAVDALKALQTAGSREVALLIMAPHQSPVSWDWYITHATKAIAAAGPSSPRLSGVVQPWWNECGYIAALTAQVTTAVAGWSRERFLDAELIFTAHALPRSVEASSPYCAQFAETARLTAEALAHPQHGIAFQSQPSDSSINWSSPTVAESIGRAHARGRREVVVQAAGFLVDHTEVVHDLDVEARAEAQRLGMGYTRAGCVATQPHFISMLADRVIQCIDATAHTSERMPIASH